MKYRRKMGGGTFHIPYSIFHQGFSLAETLVAVAILSLALLIVAETLLSVTRSFAVLRATAHLAEDASAALGRMVREARGAESLDASSVLDAHPGKLVLSAVTASGTPRTVEFYADSGQVYLKEDGVLTGALSGKKTAVSNLVFRPLSTGRSTGVKVELTLSSGSGAAARSENFYATAVLHDSY